MADHNIIAGDFRGNAALARDITASTIVFGATPRAGPGLVSVAVPTGRLEHDVRWTESWPKIN